MAHRQTKKPAFHPESIRTSRTANLRNQEQSRIALARRLISQEQPWRDLLTKKIIQAQRIHLIGIQKIKQFSHYCCNNQIIINKVWLQQTQMQKWGGQWSRCQRRRTQSHKFRMYRGLSKDHGNIRIRASPPCRESRTTRMMRFTSPTKTRSLARLWIALWTRRTFPTLSVAGQTLVSTPIQAFPFTTWEVLIHHRCRWAASSSPSTRTQTYGDLTDSATGARAKSRSPTKAGSFSATIQRRRLTSPNSMLAPWSSWAMTLVKTTATSTRIAKLTLAATSTWSGKATLPAFLTTLSRNQTRRLLANDNLRFPPQFSCTTMSAISQSSQYHPWLSSPSKHLSKTFHQWLQRQNRPPSNLQALSKTKTSTGLTPIIPKAIISATQTFKFNRLSLSRCKIMTEIMKLI